MKDQSHSADVVATSFYVLALNDVSFGPDVEHCNCTYCVTSCVRSVSRVRDSQFSCSAVPVGACTGCAPSAQSKRAHFLFDYVEFYKYLKIKSNSFNLLHSLIL